ncbi:GNAT family N-acetyltransferase [Thermosphaera sp.]|uniref:N-acetyltransferase n=1 Tax=Thermosphaera aggregans TaxID=54254 RepID=A0A7C2BJY1_9CREN
MDVEIGHTSSVIYARLKGGEEKAFLRYHVENGSMILLETYTPPAFRGQGVAKRLVEYALELAKQKGLSIVPICSYAIYFFLKNKEYRSLLHPDYRSLSDEEWKKLMDEALSREKSKSS